MYVTVKGNVKVAAIEVEVDPADVLKACSKEDIEREWDERNAGLLPPGDPEYHLQALADQGIPDHLLDPLDAYLYEPVLDQGTLDRWKTWAACDL